MEENKIIILSSRSLVPQDYSSSSSEENSTFFTKDTEKGKDDLSIALPPDVNTEKGDDDEKSQNGISSNIKSSIIQEGPTIQVTEHPYSSSEETDNEDDIFPETPSDEAVFQLDNPTTVNLNPVISILPDSPDPLYPNSEPVHMDVCLVCLKRFPLIQMGRKLDHSETIFLKLSKSLNLRESVVSMLWDFSTEIVPICDVCFNFAQRIIELEVQAEIIQSELERNLFVIKKAFVESEEHRNEPLLDKRIVKWRGLASKVIKIPKVDKKIQPKKNGRGRPRNVQKQTPQSRKLETNNRKRKACSVMLDPLEVVGFATSPEVILSSDYCDFIDDDQFSPVVSSDSDWTSEKQIKKIQIPELELPLSTSSTKKKRVPQKIANYIKNSEEWTPDKVFVVGSLEQDTADESSSSEHMSDSEVDMPPQRKRKRTRKSQKSSKSVDNGNKWITDKRRNKLYFGSIEVHHLETKEGYGLQCTECTYKVEGFKSKDYVKSNMRKHIIRDHLGTFKCSHTDCGKVYSGRKELKNHEAAAHENVRQECEICGKPFSFETSKRRHLWSHKNAEEQAEYLATGKKKLGRPDDPCQCTQCGRSFQSSVYMKRHQRTHLDQEERLTHICETCGKRFVSVSGLNYHVTSAHRKDTIDMTDWITCPDCPRKFKKRHQLKKHLPVHTGETCCQCSICGKSFKSLSALRFHRHVHDDERANPCIYCDKAFKRRHHLQRHCQIFHPEGKNLPQRPQNRLKGPGGTDGGPSATTPTRKSIRKNLISSSTDLSTTNSNNGQVSVITNTNTIQEDDSSKYSQIPLNLVNNFHNPRQGGSSQQQHHHHHHHGQSSFTTTSSLNYEYPYDFQSLIRF